MLLLSVAVAFALPKPVVETCVLEDETFAASLDHSACDDAQAVMDACIARSGKKLKAKHMPELQPLVDKVAETCVFAEARAIGEILAAHVKKKPEGLREAVLNAVTVDEKDCVTFGVEGRDLCSLTNPALLPPSIKACHDSLDEAHALDSQRRIARKLKRGKGCWKVLSSVVELEYPVEAPETWPSTGQRLCGEVCAGRFQLVPRPEGWLTVHEDVDSCVADHEELRPNDPKLGLPWNVHEEAWRQPTHAQACAFALIAQDRLDLLPEDKATPREWAGSRAEGAFTAGGPDGTAFKAAAALVEKARRDVTDDDCGYVASQCYGTLMLEVFGDENLAPADRTKMFDANAKNYGLGGPIVRPWCQLLKDNRRCRRSADAIRRRARELTKPTEE